MCPRNPRPDLAAPLEGMGIKMNIENMVKSSRCVQCGMCSFVCPVKAVSMVFNKKRGFYFPRVSRSLCVDCGKCCKYCPAFHNDKKNTLMGSYENLLLAHSNNMHIRRGSTSGGVINELIRYLIEKKIVKAAIVTAASPYSPVLAEPVVINENNIHELLERPRDFASRYVSVPVLSKLREVKKYKGRIAVVGTPCQINALSMEGIYPMEVIKIGIACSGGMSCQATEQYKRYMHLPKAAMYYRGEGWPGKNSLKSKESVLEFPHQGSLFERMFTSQIFKNPACRHCHDQFAENADISFCDFWNRAEMNSEKDGNSCVIIRNQLMLPIFQGAVEEKRIDIVRSLREEEVIETQMQVLKMKKGNMHENLKFKIFMHLIDIIFRFKLYRIFRFRIYQKFCSFYGRLCSESEIDLAED
ncbi:coenzyme F420 hydrogenase subunit beta [Anaerocolumna jejuensis DSM 15929]|uniref:Coenzyme F420 hydrogenase subunit beta n=2 Tax=Anaerocolumna TaxID=1843210 RepID=A0A1M7BZX6_9FIRM|nr:coenzyme F420 hydrogenase subunit beta [Anaerocolumna jejuensis DSM 15929]